MFYSIGKVDEVDYYMEQRHKNVFCAPHIHHHFEFVFELSGEIEVILEGKTYSLKKDEVAVIMPYEIHEFKTVENSDIFVMGFPAKYISEYKKEFEGKTLKNPIFKMNSFLKELLCSFIEESEHSIYDKKSIVYGVLSNVLKENELLESAIPQSDVFRDAVLYIKENYKDEITLKNTAEFLGITPVHLSRVFRKKGGKCFNETVSIVRLSEATDLLRHSDLSIGEIAYYSGFGSIRNFNRIFGKYYNITPKEMRTKMKSE